MDYSIILPSKPRVVSEEATKGVYEIDGLYAGYGHTLGNSLRRAILSSLPGSAITTVKIEGAPHEFSVLPGVKEDVIMILLNLRQVKFKMLTDEPQKITISVNGVKDVTDADIKTSGQIEIVSKGVHIATLTDKNSKFEAELTIEKGLGYIPREVLRKDKVEVGTIVLDAAFTPIRRVNYEVENMRVGDRTDYNRLRFIIESDGTISPREALEKSIEILIKQLKAIVGFEEEHFTEDILKEMPGKEEQEDISGSTEEDYLKTRIEDLNLSSRTLKSLSEASIRTVGGLARKKEEDLLAIDNLGKKGVQEIRRALGNLGLTLKE
ncbi:MAG: DNA-directed RNA polymerase subunit alpha [Parcubacteria group bacterium]|nr:DNA-directed RNA polymerase subunit alpha [Parcubacteria group bacterium]MCR4342977.1 DNA-directed RNA polymerase subunit alpha [Patescibacteria group bacterium]